MNLVRRLEETGNRQGRVAGTKAGRAGVSFKEPLNLFFFSPGTIILPVVCFSGFIRFPFFCP